MKRGSRDYRRLRGKLEPGEKRYEEVRQTGRFSDRIDLVPNNKATFILLCFMSYAVNITN